MSEPFDPTAPPRSVGEQELAEMLYVRASAVPKAVFGATLATLCATWLVAGLVHPAAESAVRLVLYALGTSIGLTALHSASRARRVDGLRHDWLVEGQRAELGFWKLTAGALLVGNAVTAVGLLS